MSDTEKKPGVLASVVKVFRPDPKEASAPPPSCCGECGGDKKKANKSEEKKS
ncbi:MAG: hypothetical protein ACLGHG_02775 [Gammaproteobacteria bacterium]